MYSCAPFHSQGWRSPVRRFSPESRAALRTGKAVHTETKFDSYRDEIVVAAGGPEGITIESV
jgi:hypothetical protein